MGAGINSGAPAVRGSPVTKANPQTSYKVVALTADEKKDRTVRDQRVSDTNSSARRPVWQERTDDFILRWL